MNEMTRRYAAILAADVAGYSRLMESDGERTVQALKECRNIFNRCVISHHGREFGTVGDSLMAEFSSPVEALRAALCVQQDLDASDPGPGDDHRFQIRIGLHAGEIISDGEDVLGDVVNTTPNLQKIARPGGIAMSAFFHAQVNKEPGVRFRSLGQQTLNNVAEPMRVYEVARKHHMVNWRRMRLAASPYRAVIAATIGVLVAGAMIAIIVERRDSPEPPISTTIGIPSARIDASREYALGRAAYHLRTLEAAERARNHFENAIEFDPDYALGYVGLADALAQVAFLGPLGIGDVAMQRRAAIDQALDIDPLSGEALTAMAYLYLNHDNGADGEQFVLRARKLSPEYADAYFVHSRILYYSGRPDEALASIEEAIELAPDVPHFRNVLATTLWALGRFDESLEVLAAGAESYPTFPGFFDNMARQLSALGRYGEAMRWIDAAIRLTPKDEQQQLRRCSTFLILADVDAAARCTEKFEELSDASTFRLRISLNHARGTPEENHALMQPYLNRDDLSKAEKRFVAPYYRRYGEPEKAREIWEELEADLIHGDEIEIPARRLFFASRVANTLEETGDPERADYLRDIMLETALSLTNVQKLDFGHWPSAIYLAKGETELALIEARKALEGGYWGGMWWLLDDLEDTAELHDFVDDVMAEVERQREWYEEHRNDPIF